MEPRMISYLYFFNIAKDYFECHEYLESLWLDSGRPVVLKGLIQAAVCLYHLENGNVRGGWRMWRRARAYLAPYHPQYEGIDLESLTRDIDHIFAEVPNHWRDLVLPPNQIKDLHLPTVQLHLHDEQIRNALPTWQPMPLED